jgi:hypothetical protein
LRWKLWRVKSSADAAKVVTNPAVSAAEMRRMCMPAILSGGAE